MSWINDLYDTYEQNFDMKLLDFTTDATPLPISHSTQNAQIEITVGMNGEFINAEAIMDKAQAQTLIPVTEDSIARSSGPCAHPLEDKLEYTAGDYEKYTGKDNNVKHELYLNALSGWCDSEYSCEETRAIRQYILKNSMIKDLVSSGVLNISEKDGLLTKDKIAGVDQRESFVRFSVLGGKPDAVYKNKRIFDLYIKYYDSIERKKDICCISGAYTVCSQKHGAKVRNGGDKAKLISANDSSGFTYRGRFSKPEQAVSIGYEVSQKAHSALRWVVKKNGFFAGEQTIAAWEIAGKEIPDIMDENTINIFGSDSEEKQIFGKGIDTEYAQRIKRSVEGYRTSLGDSSRIVVMGLEAATTGRLSIRFYHKMQASVFLDNIENWYSTYFWRWGKVAGSPSPYQIASLVYGIRNAKLLGNTIERLLPCIIERQPIPHDIVRAAINKICNRASYDKKIEWERAVGMTCALIRKLEYDRSANRKDGRRKEWSMALDRNETDRSYLYGRLLGAAQKLEEVALFVAGEGNRETSSEKYFQRFRQDPVNTWKVINNNLLPYINRLKSKNMTRYENELRSIYDLFKTNDYIDNTPLTELFVLGYNCQYNSYSDKKEEEKNVK